MLSSKKLETWKSIKTNRAAVTKLLSGNLLSEVFLKSLLRTIKASPNNWGHLHDNSVCSTSHYLVTHWRNQCQVLLSGLTDYLSNNFIRIQRHFFYLWGHIHICVSACASEDSLPLWRLLIINNLLMSLPSHQLSSAWYVVARYDLHWIRLCR